MSYEKINVAAVCGKEVRIYGWVEANGKRPLLSKFEFPHHGAAVMYAQEFDELEKAADKRGH